MNRFALILYVIIAQPAVSGEIVEGTNTYISDTRSWKTGQRDGYYIYDSTGTTVWQDGPLESGPVECHGAGYWTAEEITGDGICIFGAAPNQWTVAHEMPPGSNPWDSPNEIRIERQGVWRVVHGTGRFVGMTGSGTFFSSESADGWKRTYFEGEVEFAD